MLIDKDSIVINNVSMGKYLLEVKFGYHKLWSSDSGRNLAGTQSGTLIGIFPKLSLQFRRLTKSELEIVAPILDTARQTTSYYDPNKKQQISMLTYTGDYEVTNKSIINENNKNEGFSCSVIAVQRRG